jgi:sec-independent protein translocase protein TatC
MPEPKHKREDYKAAREGGLLTDVSEHLTELRNRLIISVIVLLAIFIIAFNFSHQIITILQALAPAGSSFFQIKPGELLMTSIKVSIFSSVVIAMPLLLQQIESFLRPGLKDKELNLLGPILISSPILFWLGMAFAYFFTLPSLLEFLLGFGQGLVEARYGLEHFINLELSILSICGISFQLPIVLISLAQFGIVSSKGLLRLWRYVILGAFMLAAVITPTPDPLTMSILAGALLALFFLTILILKAMKR